MHPDWWTFALQVTNFLILVWLLQRFLYRPILAVIGRRREEIQRLIDAADRAKGAAEERRRQVEEARAAATQERERLLTEAREQAVQERAQVIEAARAEADRIVAAGELRLRTEQQSVVEHLQGQAAKLGIAVARRLLEQAGAPDHVEPFLARVVAAIAAMPAEERARLAEQAAGEGVVLASANPLPAAAAQACRARLAPVLGAEMKLGFSAEPGLIEGVELRLPNLVIGDNWRDGLTAAQTELASDGRPAAAA